MEGDFEAAVADLRYKYITASCKGVIKHNRKSNELTKSDKIDKVLTNRWIGIPIFLVFMFVAFHLIFTEDLLFLNKFGVLEEGILSPGVWLQGAVGQLFGFIISGTGDILANMGASDWVSGLVVNGILTGLDAVLSFLPQILMLFLFLSIMEDSGYMARAAFLMDRVLRRFGLSGKAFMPLLMCFGCSVPAMMATRTLEDPKERRLTVMLAPFLSCGAKLPIWAMFSVVCFPW